MEHDSEVVVDPLNIFEILPDKPLQVWNAEIIFCVYNQKASFTHPVF